MANKVLVLDAGHGLNTSGKQTASNLGKVYKEWTLNDAVVRKIIAILGDYNVTIHRTDDSTGKTDISLAERVKRTNNYNPDLFISIHPNAGGGTGTEVYWHTKGTTEDKKVANIVAPKLASQTGMKNRGVKTAEFAVITCKATAILCEGGFMDTQSDYNIITSDKGQQGYAQAVADSVIEFLGLTKVKNTSSSSTTSENKTKPVQSVGMVNTNKKVKIVKDVNVWCDVEWKNVKTQAKKGSIYHVTKQTKDGNFFFIEGGYVSTSSEFSLASALEVAPYNKIMAIRDCSLFTYCDGKYCIGNIKEWEVYETTDYKDGWYLIFGLGWVHESHVKTYPVANIACTNGIV